MIRLIISIIALLSNLQSATASPLVYNRESLTIHSEVDVPNPDYVPPQESDNAEINKPSKKSKAKTPPKTIKQKLSHIFYITTENESARSKDWLLSSMSIKGNKGVLYVLDKPSVPTIDPSEYDETNDIVFIGSYGEIKAIAKELNPAKLAEPMELEVPIKAILYLESGITEKLHIQPFDKVEHSAFPKKPNLSK
jgi:uncharacterized membrane protein (UPF0127 family)